jgi:prolycopene isomerase
MADSSFDVIVVGAGFGGSCCAALLAKRGLRVLLLDKNKKAGGKAMSLSKDGFTYTAWVVITAPAEGNPFEKALKELGIEGKVELVRPTGAGGRFKNAAGEWTDPPDGGFGDPDKLMDHLEVPADEREDALKLLTEIATMSPQDIAALDEISFAEWLSHRKVPRGIYAQLVAPMSDGCFVAPPDAVAASEAVETLQDIFLHQGTLFCKGGIGKVAEAYAYAVEAFGSRVLMRARVERIEVKRGKVTGVVTDKGSFQAPIVISNAGIQPTVLKLVGEEHFDRGYVNYVKELVPSWGFMGARYFLDAVVIEHAFGTLFSADSPWNLEKCRSAREGELPDDMCIWFEIPSNYDPDAAPKGKQIILTGHFGPADPELSEPEKRKWWDLGEQTLFEAYPELEAHIEAREYYSAKEISAISRDHVLPGQGGETIGLAQVVGQDGRYKPAVKAPIQGLFYVGCDAGGRGIGTQQATDSGIKVADLVHRYFLMHKGVR